ncbi:hypothetical protein IFR04_012368 [Cadophora malorum]|uniref:Uncharacterized protein n=1 Tax=Cadophora malorum TaxID=108018 RepID=A0A8H7W1L2_9HELO|nr:hypothetical protein IFR04_012368 [Cadophora malorum]
MKILFILTFVASVYCAVNWVAGFSSLTVYAVSGAGGLWQNFIDRCQKFEDNGGAVRGLDCVGNGVFYLMGAAAAFGAGQAGAMYILNQGVTTQGGEYGAEYLQHLWDLPSPSPVLKIAP